MYQNLKNLTPWRDSNPELSVLEADAMTSVPRKNNKNILFGKFLLNELFNVHINQ
jgi:hypothetical protein